MAPSDVIEEFLFRRYPNAGKQQAMREALSLACRSFVESGLADANFAIELCSGPEATFWSRLSEVLLTHQLRQVGLEPKASIRGGPDFLLVHQGRRIWIEVICPEPKDVSEDWLKFDVNAVVDFPHEAIILRWTSAIKEKAEKLLGSADGTVRGYLAKGIVAPEDAYVIAVNGRQLRNGPFPALAGISQKPFAVEAVFAVGPFQLLIDKASRKQVDGWHQHRTQVPKPNGSFVPANMFFDPRYRPISAIWAVDLDEAVAIGQVGPMAVIHNPAAINPIPMGLLPAHDEYTCVVSPDDAQTYTIQQHAGRSARPVPTHPLTPAAPATPAGPPR